MEKNDFRKPAKIVFEHCRKNFTGLVKDNTVEKIEQQLKKANLLSFVEFLIPTFNSKLKLKMCN